MHAKPPANIVPDKNVCSADNTTLPMFSNQLY